MLANYLEEYKKLLISKEKVIEHILAKGLSNEDISRILCNNGYIPSNEIIALYKWGNGAYFKGGEKLNNLYLIPGFYFLPLTNAIEIASEYKKSHPFPTPYWEEGWLPFLSDDMRSNYLVDLSTKNENSRVIEFSAEEAEWKVFNSIEMFFRFQLECNEQGVYIEKEDGRWVVDNSRYNILKNKWISPDRFTNSMTI